MTTDSDRLAEAEDQAIDQYFEEGDCRHGNFRWLREDQYVGLSMRLYGEWCEPELELMAKLVKPNSIIIESGSNIGVDTVPLAKMVPDGYVYAFEPQPEIYALLVRNLHKNECRNVNASCCGTSYEAATASIPILDYGKTNNFGGVSLMKKGLGLDVPVVALDDVVGRGPTPLDLIKADVEGMELPTLMGASKLIGQYRPALYLENNLGPHSPELIRWLTKVNYRCWWHTVPMFRPDNFRSHAVDVFPGVSSFNMVCLPAGDPRTALMDGLTPVTGPRDRSPLKEQVSRPIFGS